MPRYCCGPEYKTKVWGVGTNMDHRIEKGQVFDPIPGPGPDQVGSLVTSYFVDKVSTGAPLHGFEGVKVKMGFQGAFFSKIPHGNLNSGQGASAGQYQW